MVSAMDSERVVVVFDGKPVGFGLLTLQHGVQEMIRVPQIGGPAGLIRGRKHPAAVILALDVDASLAYTKRPRIIAVAHEEELATINVTIATGSIAERTLHGTLGEVKPIEPDE
jgi:hypothetical protein